MKTLKELLCGDKIVFVSIEREDYFQFLNFAFSNGFHWIGGKAIDPEHDLDENMPIAHIGISDSKTIGYVSAMCWCLDKEKRHINFKDFAAENELNI